MDDEAAVGTSERREREREEVRRKILEAARELLLAEGYSGVTMRRIAEAIEYSPTAIYHHFEDKDDVIRSLCEEDFARLLAALQEAPPPEDAVAAILHLGQAYARFGLAHPNHYRFMFMMPHHDEPEAQPDPHDHLAGTQAFQLLRGVVSRALAEGRLRPGSPDDHTYVLWSCLHGAIALLVTLEPKQFPVAPPPADLVAQVLDASLRGLLAPATTPPPSQGAKPARRRRA